MVTTITSSSLNHDRYFNRWHALMAGTLIVIAMVLVVGSAPARAETPSYVPDEILVGYLKQVAPSDITAFEKSHKLILLKEFTPLNVRHYRLPESLSVEMALELLKTEPIVDFVEPNLLEKALFLPSDPQFGEQWSLQNSGQIVNGIGGPPDIDIDWPEAMDIYTGTADVIVAVIDSGVAVDHPEIDPNGWVNIDESLDSIDNDANGYIDDVIGWDFFDNDLLPLDENGHGTLVASIIGGPINNGVGGAGVAPGIKLMLLRAGDDFGSVSNSATIDAAIYATSMGAKIINYSAGGTQVSSALQALIEWLDQQGVLLVAAAGNGGPDGIGDNNDTFPVYPASYANNNVLSVAAINRSGELAIFSNYGANSVDVAAPGTDMFGADVSRHATFFEDFETGGPGWTVGHNTDSLSTLDWTLYVDAFGRTWVTDSVNGFGSPVDYQPYTNSWVESPSIAAGLIGPQLHYRIWFDLESWFDSLFVEVTNNGLTWNQVDYVTWFSLADCPSCAFNAGSVRSVDLSDYAGQSIQIRFRLETDESIQYDGVYIDEVEINEVELFSYDGTQYQYKSGTSFAAPIVSGVAALLMSQRPDLSHHQIRQLILDNVDITPELTGKIAAGGRINAHAALMSAIMAPVSTLVDLDGTIEATNGQDLCTMVLASGKFMFSCNPVGMFSLKNLPRESNGTVKRQIYADGFFPKSDTLTVSRTEEVIMIRSGACPTYNMAYDPGVFPISAGKRINIAGQVLLQNSQTPICAMVLANGQFMFSCDGTGSYALNIPLDGNGQFKLQVYADGFAPWTGKLDEFKTTNVVRMARAAECQ